MNNRVFELYKLSNTQMRLFPHPLERNEKVHNDFVNLINNKESICISCGKDFEFDKNNITIYPNNYKNEKTYNAVNLDDYLNFFDKSNLKNKISKEEWQHPDSISGISDIILFFESFEKLYRGAMSKSNLSLMMNYKISLSNRFIEEVSKTLGPSDSFNELFNNPILEIEPLKFKEINSIFSYSYIKSWKVNGEEKIDSAKEYLKFKHSANSSLFFECSNKINSIISEEVSKYLDTKGIDYVYDLWIKIRPYIGSILEDIDKSGNIPFSFNFKHKLSTARFIFGRFFRIFKEKVENTSFVRDSSLTIESADVLSEIVRDFYIFLEKNPNLKIKTKDSYDEIGNTTKRKELAPLCEECLYEYLKSCDSCGKLEFKCALVDVEEDLICRKCLENNFSNCEECNKLINNDDTEWINDTLVCKSCAKDLKTIDVEDISKPEVSYNINMLPITDSKIIVRVLLAIENYIEKAKSGSSEKIFTSFVNLLKANGIKEIDATNTLNQIISTSTPFYALFKINKDEISKSNVVNFALYLHEIFENWGESISLFYDKYPLYIENDGVETPVKNLFNDKKLDIIKGYSPLSVVYEFAEANRGNKNFVVKMMPASNLFDLAEETFPGCGREALNFITSVGTQHFPGCIAYARIGYFEEDGYMIIDNFQRDADLQNLSIDSFSTKFENSEMAEKALRWCDKKFSKWYIQFYEWLVKLADKNNCKLYLTTFHMQKSKWNHIPARSADIYDGLPGELASAAEFNRLQKYKRNGEDETIESLREKESKHLINEIFPKLVNTNGSIKVEDLGFYDGKIWRLARKNNLLNIYKNSLSKK